MGILKRLTSPDSGAEDKVYGVDWNELDDIVSGTVTEKVSAIAAGLDAAKPAAGQSGRLYYATDTGILYRDTGSAWSEIARGETFTRLAQLSEKSHANLTNVTSGQHHAQLHKASHESGGGDALTALDAGIITSGILAAARGGLAKVLSPTWTNDFILVYKTATDQWVMEAKPAGADHNFLSATHLDTLAASVVAGDIIIGNATPKWARLAKGVDGQFLKLVSGLPAWSDPPAGADHNLLSATHLDTLAAAVVRGDLLIGNLTPKWARLPIGLANRVLKSDGTDPSWGQVGHGELTEVTSDQHHAQLHKDAHKSGGGDAFASTDLLEAIVKRLREASGPTDLLIGNVSNGQYLKRSGTGIVGDTPAGGADPETNLDLIDDFIGGSVETGEIGELGWVFATSGSAGVIDAADNNHLGIYRFSSGATLDNYICATPFNARTQFPVRFGVSDLEITLIVRCGQNVNVIYKFGFDSALSYFGEDGQKVTFEFNTVLGDSNWMCVTAGGTASTRTDSGVAFATATWFKLKIKKNAAGNWEFYIDDVLKATNTTNKPPATQGCNFGGIVQAKEATIRTFDFDFVRVKGAVTR